ncbi:unnamed protein product [Discula destructiva]
MDQVFVALIPKVPNSLSIAQATPRQTYQERKKLMLDAPANRLGGLSQAEQRELEQRMQKRQVKEFVGLFGNLVDSCFSACVNDFTSKAVTERENGCVARCVQKYMSTGQRLAERFQEHNADMATKMGGQR